MKKEEPHELSARTVTIEHQPLDASAPTIVAELGSSERLAVGGSLAEDLSQAPELKPGDLVGRFVLTSLLGEGGMGVVFVARDPELQRNVALKVLRSSAGATNATQAQQRMLREAQAMAMVSHPNLVTIFEVGTLGRSVFLAMEYVVGQTLEDWLEVPRPLEDILEVFAEAGQALQAVHDAGLVHRDFKPANVIVAESGCAKVLDLGIARKLDDAKESLIDRASALPVSMVEDSNNAFSAQLTHEGAIVGTPSYMPPEQLTGGALGPAADQFSFGVALFEALCGTRPFVGDNHIQLMSNVVLGEREPWPEDAAVPSAIRDVVDRALNHDASGRFDSMLHLLDALEKAAGIRGQIRSLTRRWLASGRSEECLLSEGPLLSEGERLLATQPTSFTDEQAGLLRESSRRRARRQLVRRSLLAGLLAVTLGLIPALVLMERRGVQLDQATRGEATANRAAVREQVAPLFARAEEDIQLMFEQRSVWMPMVEALIAASNERTATTEDDVTRAISALNNYFRPVVERTAAISSLMVARDDGIEYLVFEDPDAPTLTPPYRLYNRFVRRSVFEDDAFQLFWPVKGSGKPRTGWLARDGKDSRGRAWSGYHPTKRAGFRAASEVDFGSVAWTQPYLFFVTKDAGVTAAVSWQSAGHRYVLGVDFMLTDLSQVTADLDSEEFVAVVTTKDGRLVGLPQGAAPGGAAAVRRFFADFDAQRRSQLKDGRALDSLARLPGPDDIDVPGLAEALRAAPAHGDDVFSYQSSGEAAWAAVSPVGPPNLGLSVVVFERTP